MSSVPLPAFPPAVTVALILTVFTLCTLLIVFRRLNRRLRQEIRENREAAEALQHSHLLLNNLSLQVPGILFHSLLLPDGSFRTPYASQKTHQIYELSPAEINDDATTVFDRFHPQDRQRVLESIHSSAKNLSLWECEYRVLLPRQGLKWLYGTALPQRLDDGSIAWYGIIMDISERKRIEASMREKSQLLDLSQEAIIVRDMDGTIRFWNRGAENMYGYTAAEACGKLSHELLATAFPLPLETIDEQIRHTGHWQGQLVHTTRDGAPVSISSRWVLGRNEIGDGDFIMEINTDETQRIHAEAELRRSESKYRGLHESMMDGYGFCDMDGTIRECNETFRRMLDYSDAELKEISYRTLTPEKWHSMEERIIREQVLVRGYSDVYEKEYFCRDGTTLPVELRTTLFRDEEGRAAGMWAIIRDISDRQERQDERLKMQKLESLGVLAGGIAHDFNNILTGIMGNISFARMFLEENRKVSDILHEAEKASRRATELAQQLLAFARGSQPVRKSIPARQLLEASATLVLSGSNVRSNLEISEDLLPLDADEGQISQVFNNIIINAAQAMPGGGTITIAAHNRTLAPDDPHGLAPGEYVRFTFRDTGCGIPEEIRTKIFDPYFTTKPGGNGLGLASTHSIVTRHGGRIQVFSVPGSETVFEILLPASHEPASEQESHRSPDPVAHPGGRILVMDDEEIIRDLLAALLMELGYDVETCSSGEEAITRYGAALEGSGPFSAVIMDLTVPGGMGGKEAAERILREDPTACLIVSSGYSSDPVVAGYKDFGFSATLRKPYNVAEVDRVLGSLLSGLPQEPMTEGTRGGRSQIVAPGGRPAEP